MGYSGSREGSAMPWKEVRVLEQRMEFITAYQQGHWPLVSLCRAFGISRKTGYKFLERYAAAGVAGLADRSRAPRHHPNAMAPQRPSWWLLAAPIRAGARASCWCMWPAAILRSAGPRRAA
jgi:hypothetical protein